MIIQAAHPSRTCYNWLNVQKKSGGGGGTGQTNYNGVYDFDNGIHYNEKFLNYIFPLSCYFESKIKSVDSFDLKGV